MCDRAVEEVSLDASKILYCFLFEHTAVEHKAAKEPDILSGVGGDQNRTKKGESILGFRGTNHDSE